MTVITVYDHSAQACQAKIAFTTHNDSARELEIQQRTSSFSREQSDSGVRTDVQSQKIQIPQ
jgi:hypothetical protein